MPMGNGTHEQPLSIARTGEIQKGREEGDGTENVINCPKFYDDLWRFMTFYVKGEQRDGNYHKMSQTVVKCRKLSWRLSQIAVTFVEIVQSPFWEGDATKPFSVKKRDFLWNGGGNSVNRGFGQDFYRKGKSVKRFGPCAEPPDSENWKLLSSSPSRKSAPSFYYL